MCESSENADRVKSTSKYQTSVLIQFKAKVNLSTGVKPECGLGFGLKLMFQIKLLYLQVFYTASTSAVYRLTRMWVNAQREAPSGQRRKVWLTPNTGVPCSNAANMRNPLKFAGVPQTGKPISQPLVG